MPEERAAGQRGVAGEKTGKANVTRHDVGTKCEGKSQARGR